ncbi:MAG: hypothetical protein KDA85_19760 [Planctomycetaceae bacterium]|nr:hypothetical protein [Planctomycetaceae bacterium]
MTDPIDCDVARFVTLEVVGPVVGLETVSIDLVSCSYSYPLTELSLVEGEGWCALLDASYAWKDDSDEMLVVRAVVNRAKGVVYTAFRDCPEDLREAVRVHVERQYR